jgi:hypothetical protein
MEQTHEGSWRFLETLGRIVVCKNRNEMVNPLVRYSNTAVVIPALVLPTSESYPTPALAEVVLYHQPDAWSGHEDRHPTTNRQIYG